MKNYKIVVKEKFPSHAFEIGDVLEQIEMPETMKDLGTEYVNLSNGKLSQFVNITELEEVIAEEVKLTKFQERFSPESLKRYAEILKFDTSEEIRVSLLISILQLSNVYGCIEGESHLKQ